MTDPNNIFEQLVGLASGELDPAAAAELRARVDGDEGLAASYARVRAMVSFLSEEVVAIPPKQLVRRAKQELARSRPGLLDRLEDGLRRVVASLDFDSRLTPAVAGFRGVAEASQLAFSSEDADIDMELGPVGEERWSLRGAIDSGLEGAWSGALMERGTDRVVVDLSIDEHGAFRVEIGPGSYEIRLRCADVSIEVGPIQAP